MYICYITVYWTPTPHPPYNTCNIFWIPPPSQALCNNWMAPNGKYNIINISWYSSVTVGAIYIALWKITEWTLLPVQIRKRIHTGKLDSGACAILVTVQLTFQILGRRSCAVQFVQYRQYPPYTLHSYLRKPNCAGHIVQFFCPCVIGQCPVFEIYLHKQYINNNNCPITHGQKNCTIWPAQYGLRR